MPVIHAVFWILLIFGEVVSINILTGGHHSFLHYFYYYALNLLLFYSYIWMLFSIPDNNASAWLWRILIFIIELSVYIVLAMVISYFTLKLEDRANYFARWNIKFFVSTSWRAVYFMIFATGYFLIRRNAKLREIELEKEIAFEKLKGQLITMEKDFLRAQINPHLLFNTLSFIKHATKHDPESARMAMTILSDIMDYALDGSRNEFVPLSMELEQIENMIMLNRMRFGRKLNVTLIKEVYEEDMHVLPILLLTLVENIFKHGNSIDPLFPTIIKIYTAPTELIFTTTNPLSGSTVKKGAQTGLQNIRCRLAHTYADHAAFSYGTKENLFWTELKIRTTVLKT